MQSMGGSKPTDTDRNVVQVHRDGSLHRKLQFQFMYQGKRSLTAEVSPLGLVDPKEQTG